MQRIGDLYHRGGIHFIIFIVKSHIFLCTFIVFIIKIIQMGRQWDVILRYLKNFYTWIIYLSKNSQIYECFMATSEKMCVFFLGLSKQTEKQNSFCEIFYCASIIDLFVKCDTINSVSCLFPPKILVLVTQ